MATMHRDQIETLAQHALEGAGTSTAAAASLARAVAAAEMDGTKSHGLVYVPIYCEHVQCGKVIGDASPQVSRPGVSAVVVDAGSGFAHPAIDAGFDELIPAARENGCAGMAVRNSYNCGVLGYHVERLAKAGLVGLGFTNAPASIAPVGGKKPVIGTNPYALSVPDGHGNAAFILDQSASVIAKSEIGMHARANKPIPEGWALGADGNPTTDANEAMKGSMVPSGGYKGFGNGLMVEIFAAAISGATLGKDASPFAGTAGGPPKTGQFFFAVNADQFSGGAFGERMADLGGAISGQGDARLPGTRRLDQRANNEQNGVEVDDALIARIQEFTS
ncbi:MAG: Ldh family oxidoreductase [Rhodospirillales bacterium]|jgi:(2R)-3-sulfolactate dehydrogenase (NADP+)|nr:Ldh family oxidoreductase [Rhodospirillales bacterium]MBT4041048.1 Ldh family oxidoreductase [Rhodospirillales bacterium]MBT4626405.1 Ldh family oxidoreductase [Rhodospirillales bacterium]MBT5351193.1 Ldh family oxidoreductase [Rhodospirillales bacterium]MBT5522107.1 Ldh family oxidoreductase [Rhodospirillales bacterium]